MIIICRRHWDMRLEVFLTLIVILLRDDIWADWWFITAETDIWDDWLFEIIIIIIIITIIIMIIIMIIIIVMIII